jgi:hypothetical protein
MWPTIQAIILQTMRTMKNIYAQKTLPHCNYIAWCCVILNSYARESKIYHQCFRHKHDDVYKRIKRCYKHLNVSSDNNIEQYESILLPLATTCFLKAFIEI